MSKPLIAFCTIVCAAAASVRSATPTPYQQLGRDIYKELVETDTTHSKGDTTTAAELLAGRFRQAGFAESDVQVLGPETKNKNLVVRYRGTGDKPPVTLMAHLDVVEAKREDLFFNDSTTTE